MLWLSLLVTVGIALAWHRAGLRTTTASIALWLLLYGVFGESLALFALLLLLFVAVLVPLSLPTLRQEWLTRPLLDHVLRRRLPPRRAALAAFDPQAASQAQQQALHALHVIHTRVPTAGERSWTAKLNEEQVADIRQRYGLGEKQKTLADDYDVHPSTISNIVHAVTWGGEYIARTKGLTPAQKAAIRAGLMAGQTGADLARQYGVSPATISRFRHRRA